MKRRLCLLQSFLVAMMLAGLLLAACGGPVMPTPTPLPTATATPRSTPIPPVPTAVPLAVEENPLTILMLPQGTRRAAVEAAGTLEALILDLAGLTVNVEIVNSYGEIVAQLCGATPVVGWVSGPSYIVAEAQGCADPALLVVRDRATGFRVDLLMAANLVGEEATGDDIARLEGESFCRLNSEDTITWFIPSLMLYAAGVNPLSDLDEIVEVENYDAIISAIYNGDCAAGAVPDGYFVDEIGADLRALGDLQEKVVALPPSPVIPYDILVYPQTVPLNVRIPLNDVFVQISVNAENARVLASILQQDSLRRVGRADFDEFRAFMMATGLDFTVLGE